MRFQIPSDPPFVIVFLHSLSAVTTITESNVKQMVYFQEHYYDSFMGDIREIDIEMRDVVEQMLKEFVQKMDESHRPKPETINRMFELWSEGKIVILGKFDDGRRILGIVILALPSNRLLLVHVHTINNDLDKSQVRTLERELFDAGFKRLKRYEPWVTSGGPVWLTENLIDYALEVGFKPYNSVTMTADRETMEDVPEPIIPSGYTLKQYESKWNEAVAELIYESFKNGVDVNADPNLLSTLERCLVLANDTISGHYGDFKNGKFSWILTNDNEIVGMSLCTFPSETATFVAGMCLKQTCRGMGLGKLIFVHSLRYLLKNAPKVNQIELSVYDTNPAKHLYESVGFKEKSRSQSYTWAKDVAN